MMAFWMHSTTRKKHVGNVVSLNDHRPAKVVIEEEIVSEDDDFNKCIASPDETDKLYEEVMNPPKRKLRRAGTATLAEQVVEWKKNQEHRNG